MGVRTMHEKKRTKSANNTETGGGGWEWSMYELERE